MKFKFSFVYYFLFQIKTIETSKEWTESFILIHDFHSQKNDNFSQFTSSRWKSLRKETLLQFLSSNTRLFWNQGLASFIMATNSIKIKQIKLTSCILMYIKTGEREFKKDFRRWFFIGPLVINYMWFSTKYLF